jgi:uncharacterized protein YuzE
MMRPEYDSEADALYVYAAAHPRLVFVPAGGRWPAAKTVEIDDGTFCDADTEGGLIGIELPSPRRPWPVEEIARRWDLSDHDRASLAAISATFPAPVE